MLKIEVQKFNIQNNTTQKVLAVNVFNDYANPLKEQTCTAVLTPVGISMLLQTNVSSMRMTISWPI